MDEVSKIANAYYIKGSDHQKKLARDFFIAMDGDGDGKIDRKEFIEFMRNMEFMNNQGHDHMKKLSFFKQLDLDGNGILDFSEVMTLFYILKSGRPFCDKCNMFIRDTYFTCVGCLEAEDEVLIHLCLKCYIAQKSDHTHNGLSRYVDNHSLLEATLKLKLNTARSRPYRPSSMNDQASTMGQVPNSPPTALPQNVVQPVYHTTNIQNNYSFHHTSSNPVRTLVVANANVPGWKVALERFSTALNIANTTLNIAGATTTLCSIL